MSGGPPGAVVATPGTIFTGGGGGGQGSTGQLVGSGGSGVAILRYPTFYPKATIVNGALYSTASGYNIYKFITSGNILI